MSLPIKFNNITQAQPYASFQDVYNLIGPVLDAASLDQSIVQSAINSAQRYIEKNCNTVFTPRRIRFNQDGNGGFVLQLLKTPVINVNSIEIYSYNLLGLRSIIWDYQLVVNPDTGVVSYPLLNGNILLAPILSFLKGNQNIRVDLHTGYMETVYDEILETTDFKTYTFANQMVVEYTELQGPNEVQPPLISPCIYINGVYQQNRVYQWSPVTNISILGAQPEPFNTLTWQIAEDNLVYTLNKTSSGITGITFNTPQSGNIITAQYRNALIPEDITEATTKKAAITVLTGLATHTAYSDIQFMGVDEVQSNNARLMMQTGRWGFQISQWLSDIKEVIIANKQTQAGIVGNNINNPYHATAGNFGAIW